MLDEDFKDNVKHHLWKAWKQDAFMAPSEDHWNDLNHEDHDEFHQHVRDVVHHAEKHGIKNAKKAVSSHDDHMAKVTHVKIKEFKAALKSHLH